MSIFLAKEMAWEALAGIKVSRRKDSARPNTAQANLGIESRSQVDAMAGDFNALCCKPCGRLLAGILCDRSLVAMLC